MFLDQDLIIYNLDNSEELNPMTFLKSSLNGFERIGLESMTEVNLMNRVDSKYTVPIEMIPWLLSKSSKQYFLQQVNGKVISKYSTIYYDDCNLRLYNEHVNGKLNRYKIRSRTYLDTDTHFVELKIKNNKGRTTKIREESRYSGQLSNESKLFLLPHIGKYMYENLQPAIFNQYYRITLAERNLKERITIDFDLKFMLPNSNVTAEFPLLSIIEIKQQKSAHSPIVDLLRGLRLRPSGLSKYCLGISTLHTRAKKNTYKKKLHIFNNRFYDRTIFEPYYRNNNSMEF